MLVEEKDFSGQPEKPDPSDCCNSGCNPCVLDLYEKRLKEWKNSVCNNRSSDFLEIRNDLLSETKLKPFILINKINVCKNIYRLKFQPALNSSDQSKNALSYLEKTISGILPYKIGQHIIFKGGVRTEQTMNYISRAYTPITVSSEMSNCCFEIVVKIYENGEMSKYLNMLQLGDTVACRGPYGNFVYNANKYHNILLLCIGTGITAMYNLIKSVVNNDEDETFVHLMYGVQTTSDIILREELRQFTAYWNFKEEIYLSKQSDDVNYKFGETFIYKQIDNAAIVNYANDKNTNELLVLICGTNVFSESMEKCILDLGINKNNIHIF